MSENRTDSRGTSQADDRSRPERDQPERDQPERDQPERDQPERERDEFQAGTSYQPSTNQARDEPLPASHHDDGRPEEARRRGEPARDDSSPGQGGRGHAGRGT